MLGVTLFPPRLSHLMLCHIVGWRGPQALPDPMMILIKAIDFMEIDYDKFAAACKLQGVTSAPLFIESCEAYVCQSAV